jgi:hypothetical protein
VPADLWALRGTRKFSNLDAVTRLSETTPPMSATKHPRTPRPEIVICSGYRSCGYRDADNSMPCQRGFAKHLRVATTHANAFAPDSSAQRPPAKFRDKHQPPLVLPEIGYRLATLPTEFVNMTGCAASFKDASWAPDIYASPGSRAGLDFVQLGLDSSHDSHVERRGDCSVGGQGEELTDGQDEDIVPPAASTRHKTPTSHDKGQLPEWQSTWSRSDFFRGQLLGTTARTYGSANTARMSSITYEQAGSVRLYRESPTLDTEEPNGSHCCLCPHDSRKSATNRREVGGYATSTGIHNSALETQRGSGQASTLCSHSGDRTEAKASGPSQAIRQVPARNESTLKTRQDSAQASRLCKDSVYRTEATGTYASQTQEGFSRELSGLNIALAREMWNWSCRVLEESSQHATVLPLTVPRQMEVC